MTFGASDAPLKGEELDKIGLAQFPMVMGGIVPVVNLDGIKPGELTIDGPTLAKIFLGEIKTWDDAAIKKLNPSAKLPNQAIAVVHRSDGSGTTYNFVYYLSDVSADWKSKVGVNTSVQWPVGIGAKGNEGVANNVANTKGSIGYVEYAYALQNKLTYTKMVNKAGKTVTPTSEAFQAAAANADWKSQPGYGVILANQPGDKSWPMTAATWILVYKKPADAAATGEALKFFAWAYKNGGKMAEEPRLRADAGQCGQGHREVLEDRDQGRERQAGLRDDDLIYDDGKGRRSGALSLSTAAARRLVLRPRGRLSGSPERPDAQGEPDAIRREATRG